MSNAIVNEEPNFESFLDDFEQKGAALSSPVLPEGKYRGHLTAVTMRSGLFTPSKGANIGKEQVWANWGARIALDSVSANAIMKRDGDVTVYADNDTINTRKGGIATFGFGIARENNAAFWTFVGALLAPVGLAEEIKQDSGETTYTINRNALEAIYAHTKENLEELQADGSIPELLIPAKLAEKQLANLTEFLTSEEETRKVYVHIARRSNYSDKSRQEHFVKQIMFPAVFEENQRNLDELVD